LAGTYKTWLSESTSAPISRFVPSSGPYRLVNGTMIAANWADLTDGTLLASITVTETGGGLGATSITWTHTGPNGSRDGVANEHCANWTTNNVQSRGGAGFADQTNIAWTKIESFPCSNHRHLYCFQQS
jgi:hypothetical protein